ncbi:PAS domain S-box protein [Schlesneria paludicola]|uniref:PAS domain S-box protein n=1 Tax=Schlesneria paludicola TaxID=360056 RepID=UPI00029ACEF6|nr:PAS domain S-box protein [Schlesneria paludicola]
MADANDSTVDPTRQPQFNSQQLLDFNPDPAFIQIDNHVVQFNQDCLRLFGAERPEQLHQALLVDLLSPEFRGLISGWNRRQEPEKTRFPLTSTTIRRLDGTYAHVASTVVTLPPLDQRPQSMIIFRESQQPEVSDGQIGEIPFLTILETAMDGIISMNERHEIVLFNAAAELIFGWKSEQVLGQPIDMLIPGRFRGGHRKDVERFGAGTIERRRMGEQRTVMALRMSGEEFPIEASISQTSVKDKKIFTVILRDVTEAILRRRQIEEQSEMLDQVSDAVIVVDLNDRITYWNHAATRLFGWTAQEAIGQHDYDLLFSGDKAAFWEMQRTTNARGSWGGEMSKSTRSGKMVSVEHRRTILRDEAGKIKGYLCINIDITERKKRERAAHRSQRLESIGTLAGGIAHDLNNVLTPIMMGAKLLSKGRALENREGLLDTMMASAQRGADLVKQLLAFAGGIRGERQPVDLAKVMQETRELMVHTLPKSIQIEMHVDPDCPHVLGDPTEISQILMNLCINARDAMPNGGTLRMDASPAQLNENAAQVNPGARAGLYTLIQIADTGTGMAPEILDRIFDPFFTTKDVGKGTGLGLATVQGIVKSYGGFISVYSESGRGTTFSIYLPATVHEFFAHNGTTSGVTRSGAGLTVLIVDDELPILKTAEAALRSCGYDVLTAADGLAAIEIVTKYRSRIAAVLLDMMMPGLDGQQTLGRLQQIAPSLPVIACSGLRTTQRETEVIKLGARMFLSKPYSADQLAQALSDVIPRGA